MTAPFKSDGVSVPGTADANIPAGDTGMWCDEGDGLPYWRKADESDVAMTGGGGGGVTSAVAGTGISVSGATGDVTFSINTSTTVDKTTAQELTNKTLTSAVLTTPTITGATAVTTDGQDLGDATHRVDLFTSSLTAGASTMAHATTVADGAAAVGYSFRAANLSNTTAKIATFGVSSDLAGVWKDGSYYVPDGAAFGYGTAGGGTNITTGWITANGYMQARVGNGYNVSMIGGDFYPTTDLGVTSGDSTHRWGETWSRRYYGIEQPVTSSGGITVAPASGETYRLLANGNVTSLGITTGTYPGQIITLILVQDAAGTSTWPSTFTNATLAGGTFTKTTTANAVDTVTFRYDATSTKWREISRCLNQS